MDVHGWVELRKPAFLYLVAPLIQDGIAETSAADKVGEERRHWLHWGG